MEILALIFVAVVAIVGGVMQMRHSLMDNPNRVDRLRRRDGSYADYDFPGIWNGGRLRDYFFPRVHPAADVDSVEKAAGNVDLYGRPLSSAIVAKREAESRIEANPDVQMRPVQPSDWEVVLQILVPVIRAGETYALPRDMSVEEIHRVWIELPQAFQHPQKGFVDALVMFKSLVESRASSESSDEMHLRVGGEQFDLDRG